MVHKESTAKLPTAVRKRINLSAPGMKLDWPQPRGGWGGGNFRAGSALVGKVSWGWPRVLSSMKSFLATGKGLNVFAGC
jgi:hypothetical protein